MLAPAVIQDTNRVGISRSQLSTTSSFWRDLTEEVTELEFAKLSHHDALPATDGGQFKHCSGRCPRLRVANSASDLDRGHLIDQSGSVPPRIR
jgi:hypothetical protein